MKCAICDNRGISLKLIKDGIKIMKCKNCCYEFLFPRPDQNRLNTDYSNNKISSIYYYLENIDSERAMFLHRFNKVKNILPKKGVLLDVGCNIGTCSEIFYNN